MSRDPAEDPEPSEARPASSPQEWEAALGYDAAKAARDAVLGYDAARAARDAVLGYDAAKIARDAVRGADMAELMRSVVAAPDFGDVLRRVVRPPRFADTIHTTVRSRYPTTPPSGFQSAAQSLLGTLGVDGELDADSLAVRPTVDDVAFRAIAEASPDTAAAIEQAASRVGNPLLPSRIVRNMLAWLVMSLIVVAYVGGTVLFPPWGPIAVALLSASGVSVPAAYRAIVRPPD